MIIRNGIIEIIVNIENTLTEFVNKFVMIMYVLFHISLHNKIYIYSFSLPLSFFLPLSILVIFLAYNEDKKEEENQSSNLSNI